jgi:HEAT repeat protein
MFTRLLFAMIVASPAAASPACGADEASCTIGVDRMVFPPSDAPLGADIAPVGLNDWPPDAEIAKRLGKDTPFRPGVSLLRCGAGLWARDGGACALVHWDSVGYFLKGIENSRQLTNLLWVIQHCEEGGPRAWEGRHLTVAQLKTLICDVETKGNNLPFRILGPGFDENLISQKYVFHGGFWLANFAVITGDSIVEYKYAVDPRHRVSQLARLLVMGPNHYPGNLVYPANLDSCSLADQDVVYFNNFSFAVMSGGSLPPAVTTSRRADSPLRRAHLECCRFLNGSAFLPQLRKDITSKDFEVRRRAIARLASVGPAASDTVPELRRALSEPDLFFAAAETLGQIGPAAKGAVPELCKALSAEDVEVRAAAARALGGIGPAATDAVPDLRRAMRGLPLKKAWYCGQLGGALADAIGEIGPTARDALPELRRAVTDEVYFRSRPSAVRALAKIGAGAEAVVPDLRKALNDGDQNVRAMAADALGCMGPAAAEAVPDLIRGLNSERAHNWGGWEWFAMADALGNIGPAAMVAVPDILRGNPSDDVDGAGIEAAAKLLGPASAPGLRKVLADPKPWHEFRRGLAARLLVTVTPAKDVVAADLEKLLFDRSRYLRITAAELLGGLGAVGEKAVRPLSLAAYDADWAVREAVVKAAGSLLLAAKRSGDAGNRRDVAQCRVMLYDALNDNDYVVRNAAAEALEKVGR